MPSPNTYRIKVDEIPAERLEWKMSWLCQGMNPNDPLACAAALIAFSALRPKEVIGLSWGDVDLNAKTARIRRICTHGGLRDIKATRVVSLSQEAIWALEDLLKGRNANKRRPNLKPQANEPVVCDDFGRRADREYFSSWWRSNRHRFGMYEWTLFDLRNAGILYVERRMEAGC